jgi:4-amino-4-deoxy-L-arabinose transferase-like glycosyltransferase
MTTPSTTDGSRGPEDPPAPRNAWSAGTAPAPAEPPGPHGTSEATTLSEPGPRGGPLPHDDRQATPHAPAGWPTPPPNPTTGWARWALAALLAGTAALYLWDLSRNGWANSYYSAAAQAGGDSWTAWFFGSFDAANAITVDKPPASLWLMGLSVRLFGLSSWSILVPQALLGVGSVALLYTAVRRWFGAPAGLIAGAALALTPVATLMFRYNNPDALLVFLLVAAAWAMGRATERGSLRWIVLAGGFVGMAFLAKMMQAFLVLPGFVAMYAVAAPVDWRRRTGHLLAALGAMVVAGGWWVAIVELWPGARPYIGGSQTDSVVELLLGYNGFGRLTGDEVGSVVPGGGTGQGGMWGETGWDRLLSSSYGGQVAWLLPAALVMVGVLLWTSRRAARTDLTRAAVLGWGGWLLVTGAVISFSRGIIHEYYTVALAPAIGALVGIGCAALWAHRGRVWARVAAATLVAGSAWWSAILLGRSEQFVPWLGAVLAVGGLGVAAALVLAPLLPRTSARRLALAAGLGGLVVALAGPAAYSLETAASAANGSLPSAGPTVAGAGGGPAGMPGGPRGQAPGGAAGQGGGLLGPGPMPGGDGKRPALPGTTGAPDGSSQLPALPGPDGTGSTPGVPNGTAQPGGGSAGSLLDGSTPSPALTAALLADAESYTWVAATVGANSAAGYQLATEEPVMAIGGFNGSDPSPTLAEFQAQVADGRIHWFIAGGSSGRGGPGGGQPGGSQAASEISAWVSATFPATSIDGVTLYDLTGAATGLTAAGTGPELGLTT